MAMAPWLFAATAQAAITHVDPVDIVIPTDFGGIYIDLNAATTSGSTESGSAASDSYTISYSEPASGDWDVNFIFGGAGMIHNESINVYREGGGTDNLSAVSNLAGSLGLNVLIDGDPIGSAQPLDVASFGGSGAYPADSYMGAGSHQFTSGVDGYIGFVLDENTTPLYGWMRVTLNDDGTPGLVKEWAYSDAPIEVGQVPEPTITLMLLAGPACLLLRRRRAA